jgi:hypothetical protein
MKDPFIFWTQHLQVSGPCGAGAVAERIRSLINISGISVNERLIGALDGDSIRVWRTAPLAQAGDVVEFRGALRADGDGSVIEGSVGYNLRTRLQFVGCLAFGLFLTGVGVIHWMQDLSPGKELAAVGAFVTLATLMWIYSSRKLAWKQIAFIEDELARSVAE